MRQKALINEQGLNLERSSRVLRSSQYLPRCLWSSSNCLVHGASLRGVFPNSRPYELTKEPSSLERTLTFPMPHSLRPRKNSYLNFATNLSNYLSIRNQTGLLRNVSHVISLSLFPFSPDFSRLQP